MLGLIHTMYKNWPIFLFCVCVVLARWMCFFEGCALFQVWKVAEFEFRPWPSFFNFWSKMNEWMDTRLISIFYLFVHLLSYFLLQNVSSCNIGSTRVGWVPGPGGNNLPFRAGECHQTKKAEGGMFPGFQDRRRCKSKLTNWNPNHRHHGISEQPKTIS